MTKSSCRVVYSTSRGAKSAWRMRSLSRTVAERREETRHQNKHRSQLLMGRELSFSWLEVPAGDILVLPPSAVALGNHDVENPLVAFFFGFDQTQSPEVEEITLNEMDLLFAHAAALQVEGEAGEMRRSGVALRRCSIAIVAAKLLLNLHSSDSRVDLNLVVKLMVVRLAKIFDEVARPWAAEAAVRIQSRVDAQRLAGPNRKQSLRCDERLKFVVILDARQIEPIDFFVLQQERLVRRPEHWVPGGASGARAMRGARRMNRRSVNVSRVRSARLMRAGCVRGVARSMARRSGVAVQSECRTGGQSTQREADA
jgi:hypothetical protein